MSDPKDVRNPKPDAPSGSSPTHAADPHAFAATIASGGKGAEDLAPVLEDEEVVAGRYRVVRYIARGGMGEVYEAEDLELRERVALKTIRERAKDAVAEDRFKREIQLSRKVTHPNVCRIFDVGFHDRAGGERVVFFTMELLVGETLLERIRRDGPLSLEESAVIVRQIVAGLTAAHAVRVVHRDLKSANVLLVPKGNGGVRAVVTDFGLAHVSSEEARGRTLSGSGGIVGTPGYMAPEQVEGGELSERTDVYALGVVMFEMLTGQLPFDGATPLSIAAKRLTIAAPSPKKLRPELPPQWERAVLSCLRRHPIDRPQSARSVLVVLDDDSSNVSRRLEKLHRRAPLVRPLTALFIALVAVGAGVWMLRDHNDLGVALRKRGVTLGQFDAADTSIPSGFETAVRNALRVELMTDLPVLESTFDVSLPGAVETRIGLSRVAPPSKNRPFRIDGRVSVGPPGEVQSIEVALRIFDPDTNEQRTVVIESGGVRQLSDVIERAGARLRTIAELPERHAQGLSAPGATALAKAQELARRGEIVQALEVVEQAMVADPDSVELHFMHARLLAGLQLDFASSVAAARTLALGPSPDPFWAARAQALAKRGDAARSAELLQALRKQRPDDVDLALDWVAVLVQAQRDAEAFTELRSLAARGLLPRDELRVKLMELVIATKRSRHEPVLAGYEALATRATALGLPALAMEAQKLGCAALQDAAQYDRVDVVCGELERAATAARRSDLVTWAWSVRVAMISSSANALRGTALTRRSLALAGALGAKHMIADIMNATGIITAEEGDTNTAIAWMQEAIAFAQDVHDHSSQVISMNNLAYYKGRAGDLPAEIRFRRESLDLARDVDAGTTLSFALCALGLSQIRAGRLPAAVRLLDESMSSKLASNLEPSCEQLRAEIQLETNHLDEMQHLLGEMRARARKTGDTALLRNADLDECDLHYRLAEWTHLVACAPKMEDSDDPRHLYARVLTWIGQTHLGQPGPSAAERAEVNREVAAMQSYPMRTWTELALLDLDRVSGVPLTEVIARLDRFIEGAAAKEQRRIELYARYIRLEARAAAKAPTLRADIDDLVEIANQGGFLRIAYDARKLAPAH